MKAFRIAAWVCGLALFALLAGCATGPRISTEADPEADFARYRSFGFYSPLAIEREGYSSAASERMKSAARAQMESRGYVFTTDKPDLWVNINAFTERRTDVYRYTEGTINIDLVDVARNRLVWEGIAVGRVSNTKDPVQRDARIDGAIADIFAEYPYRAGSVPAPR